MKIQKIEIEFPLKVELPTGFEQTLTSLVNMICRAYNKENPTRVMWPAGQGFKPTYIPFTKEEEKERGMEFDKDIYLIEVWERESHKKEKK